MASLPRNRRELVDHLAASYPELTRYQVDGIVRHLFHTIEQSLVQQVCAGEGSPRVYIKGFGSFTVARSAVTTVHDFQKNARRRVVPGFTFRWRPATRLLQTFRRLIGR